MPSVTISEEPRYNGLEIQRQPVSSVDDASCSSQTATDPSRNDYMNELSHIDPPLGFEPTPESNRTTPSPTAANVQSNNCMVPRSTPGTNFTSNLNEYCGIPEQAGTDNGNQNAQSSDNQVIRLTESQEPVTSTTSSSSARTNPTNYDHHDSNHDNVNNHNKNHLPSTSNSSCRFVSGLNNIVTRISRVIASTSLSMLSTDRCTQDEPTKFALGNRRALEKTWKLMDKVVKCCQHPRMNLNNSPPFILEILPETYQHLKLIQTKYDSQPINDNDYSQLFLKNLQNRCEQTLKLFKDAKDEMYDEESEYRHKLTRNTLVFNHILSELRAIFPNGSFIGDKYLITKKESAGEFWRSSFGSDIMVDWKTFYHALQQVHSIDSSFFSLHALKQTIDLTCDDHISIFEFDVFTRLFQPWSTLLKNWQTLAVTHPGYKAFLTYDELKARLQKHINKPGSYVFRLSCTRLGQWAIGYVTRDGQILQTIVQNISLSQALTETEFYIYPDGKDEDPELRDRLCSGMTGDERNVTVTEEQYEIYCGVGNSFQTCKICFENDKDIRVEPCNHLLCTSCLLAWQESEGQGCPYCRTEIKETVQITMDLPKSGRID